MRPGKRGGGVRAPWKSGRWRTCALDSVEAACLPSGERGGGGSHSERYANKFEKMRTVTNRSSRQFYCKVVCAQGSRDQEITVEGIIAPRCACAKNG